MTYALETYVVTSGPESLAQYARGLSQGSRAVRARYFSAVWGAFPPDVGAAEADMLAVVLPQLVNLQLLDTGTWPAASPGQLVEAVVGLPALRAVKWSGWGGGGTRGRLLCAARSHRAIGREPSVADLRGHRAWRAAALCAARAVIRQFGRAAHQHVDR